MIATKIVEYRYSVSDVVFEDEGDMEVPSEYQRLYAEYCAEVDLVLVDAPLWCALECHYKSCLLEKSRHKAYTRSLLCSDDPKKIEAAVEAMKRILLKWDSSPAIAKMNQQAYAAREQQRLRARAAPKIRAWEEEYRRNPYYPDKQSLESMREREEIKLQECVEAYQQKWRSNGYPVPESKMGDDGYMVVEMPESYRKEL